jgi:hypothetical protein
MSSGRLDSWDEKHSFTWDEYFDARFKEAIKIAKLLVNEVGEKRAYELIAQNTFEAETEYAKDVMKEQGIELNSLEDLETLLRSWISDPYFQNSIEEDYYGNVGGCLKSDVRKCIWAHTFRKYDASEIGYYMACYGDYGMANAFGPKAKLKRTKTLMRGDDCCDFEWYWEE